MNRTKLLKNFNFNVIKCNEIIRFLLSKYAITKLLVIEYSIAINKNIPFFALKANFREQMNNDELTK